MDVYTNPPSNTYVLNSLFSVPVDGKEVRAIAVKNSLFPTIAVIYTILIQVLFHALWQLLSNLIVAWFPLETRMQYVGLIAFWNSSDPWTALGSSASYLHTVFMRSKGHASMRRERMWGVLTFLGAFILSFGSLAVGLLYIELLPWGQAAPVHPAAIFIPFWEDNSYSTSSQFQSVMRPSVLRALGSAEAVDLNTRRSSVSIEALDIPSNSTHPQAAIAYSYNITAADFGLQHHLGHVFRVSGRCSTEYSWLRSSPIGRDGEVEEYYPWGYQNLSFPAFGTEWPGVGKLDIAAFIHPQTQVASTNKTIAIVVNVAGVASFTAHTGDPWYFTESVGSAADAPPIYAQLGTGYRIKAGRPALSCWEESFFCQEETCGLEIFRGIPKGLQELFGFRLSSPMLFQIITSAWVQVLEVSVGSSGASVIDAEAASMLGDFQRIVLAAYLASKETLRDSTLMAQFSGAQNAVLDGRGSVKPGAGDFFLHTGDVVALRFDLIIIAPALIVIAWLALLWIERSRHAQEESSEFQRRSVGLKAPQLFRMLAESGSSESWARRSKAIPLFQPENNQPSATEPRLRSKGLDPLIRFEPISIELGAIPAQAREESSRSDPESAPVSVPAHRSANPRISISTESVSSKRVDASEGGVKPDERVGAQCIRT